MGNPKYRPVVLLLGFVQVFVVEFLIELGWPQPDRELLGGLLGEREDREQLEAEDDRGQRCQKHEAVGDDAKHLHQSHHLFSPLTTISPPPDL